MAAKPKRATVASDPIKKTGLTESELVKLVKEKEKEK